MLCTRLSDRPRRATSRHWSVVAIDGEHRNRDCLPRSWVARERSRESPRRRLPTSNASTSSACRRHPIGDHHSHCDLWAAGAGATPRQTRELSVQVGASPCAACACIGASPLAPLRSCLRPAVERHSQLQNRFGITPSRSPRPMSALALTATQRIHGLRPVALRLPITAASATGVGIRSMGQANKQARQRRRDHRRDRPGYGHQPSVQSQTAGSTDHLDSRNDKVYCRHNHRRRYKRTHHIIRVVSSTMGYCG
jgi:hypothetical protein